MNLYELVEHLNGEIVSNKAYVRVDGKVIVVGSVTTGDLEFTEEGSALADAQDTKSAPSKKASSKKSADVPDEE